jgi:hypothetical protein
LDGLALTVLKQATLGLAFIPCRKRVQKIIAVIVTCFAPGH